uniref:VWFA domain-containing protein n=1 Tax=Zooxanthella nutricula TaxID=1333877 RepID=A0A7S2MPH4_9DINO
MKDKFDLLVLPHHTQVICLLVFRCFLETKRSGSEPHALIAQVGTGEGKSMIIAALALYVVVVLRKKAHVVVDDETLLDRDFWTFKPLFDAFTVPAAANSASNTTRPIASKLCVSEDRLSGFHRDDARLESLSARVDADADICYCEAKHVQSFYASIARGGNQDFDGYEGRVLILDEVDALIIDEEPNEAFVYPNKELSEMATTVAEAMAGGATPGRLQEALRDSPHPAAERVVREMCQEWTRGARMKASDDFVYAKEMGRYCALQGGRANPKAWSLALECRNFQDGLSREILFQERLFVMSRPRVFRKYHRIMGLSGSIGSGAERAFLKETYRAAFFEVPPFLKTCRGSPFHEAVPVALGSQRQAVYVEASPGAQLTRLAEVVFEARERVPVLVIARDRAQCDHLVESLRQAARSRGLGSTSDDMVRSLSRTLFESDPEQWKDNLNRSTLPLGDGSGADKCWRVTVADPRGGRGTDYRVDDPAVDAWGGLLLVPTAIPTSQREWTQYLGRTARQDRRGQFCAVLCAAEYAALSAKYGEALPSEGSGATSLEAVEAIISWGDREIAGRIRASAALYHCGVRVNEICEELFGRQPQLLRDPLARERLVEICQRLRWMGVGEVDDLASQIPGFKPAALPSEARDLGRPQEPPVAADAPAAGPQRMVSAGGAALPRGQADAPPKVVIFCLDWSLSMLSQDTGTNLTRFGTCVACVRRILRDQVRDQDLVGVVGFGAQVETVVPPTVKGTGAAQVDARIAGLKAQMLGGTCFFDAVSTCLQQLGQAGLAPAHAPRWLVCLTDGDDLGSRRENMSGELVTRALETSPPANLNMVMITVGKLKERNVRVVDGWVARVASRGGFAQHLSERNATAITSAFGVVAECLGAEVGGANEC